MKLIASVQEVKSSGERLCLRMMAKSLPNETLYQTIMHEIEIPDTGMARKTYFIGRNVTIEIKPE